MYRVVKLNDKEKPAPVFAILVSYAEVANSVNQEGDEKFFELIISPPPTLVQPHLR